MTKDNDMETTISKSVLKRISLQTGDNKSILHNKCQCNVCKEIIESKSRHHWVQCSCGRIFTDGGKEYIHRGFQDPTDIVDLTEYND